MSGNVTIGRRIYLVADQSRAVEDGDPEAAILLCPAGGEIPRAKAERYGLLEPAAAEPATGEAEDEPAEKARQQVPNKARSRAANK